MRGYHKYKDIWKLTPELHDIGFIFAPDWFHAILVKVTPFSFELHDTGLFRSPEAKMLCFMLL